MKHCQQLVIVWVALLGLSGVARAQTKVLYLDSLGSAFGTGLLSQDRTEFFYSRKVPGIDPNTLHAISLTNPGSSRQIPTSGIDVSQYLLDRFAGGGSVSDSTNKGVFSVDFIGNETPIPLSPEPGTGRHVGTSGGQAALTYHRRRGFHRPG